MPNAYDNQPCPATAQFAVEQARQLAKNLDRASRGVATKPFCFRSRGMLASIGHRDAVAVIYGVKLSGFVAWCLWRGIYLAKLLMLSRKLEGPAMKLGSSLLFPPNIVQLGLSKKQSARAECERAEALPAPRRAGLPAQGRPRHRL